MFHRITALGKRTREIHLQLGITRLFIVKFLLSSLNGLVTGHGLAVIGIDHMTGGTTGCPVIAETMRGR